jgi:hypothetical protein
MENIIYSYTRKDAIEDGMQVRLDDSIVKEAGFVFPVYITSGIQNIIDRSVASNYHYNDIDGVTWDILSMLMFAIKTSSKTNDIEVVVRINGAGRKKNYHFLAQIGPVDIDDPSPAITIMFPEEV